MDSVAVAHSENRGTVVILMGCFCCSTLTHTQKNKTNSQRTKSIIRNEIYPTLLLFDDTAVPYPYTPVSPATNTMQ